MSSLLVESRSVECLTGIVEAFVFIRPPRPGEVLAQLVQENGTVIDLVESQPLPPGSLQLADVDGRRATVCGRFRVIRGRVVFDVRRIRRAPTPPPQPGSDAILRLLVLVLLLLLQGRLSRTSLQALGLANLANLNVSDLFAIANLAGINLQNPSLAQELSTQLRGINLPNLQEANQLAGQVVVQRQSQQQSQQQSQGLFPGQ